MKKNKKQSKSKLSLDDLKKQQQMKGESLDALSGGTLGRGPGGTSPANVRRYDGDLEPPSK
jgi:hypothetical protein